MYGLNLALSWASDPGVALATTHEVNSNAILIDPLRRRVLMPFCGRSVDFRERLLRETSNSIRLSSTLLCSLGNDLKSQPGPHGGLLEGNPSLGVVFFEAENLGRDARAVTAYHICILAGSSWNAEVLRAHGIPQVETVFQGIDATLFHPAPKRALFSDRFLVFGGGKLEPRKGQDNVLAAWRVFAARHPDAMLVAAWDNLWPQIARGINDSARTAPLPFTSEGEPGMNGWATANEIKPE